jgi:hypothetical protein
MEKIQIISYAISERHKLFYSWKKFKGSMERRLFGGGLYSLSEYRAMIGNN